MKSFLKFIYYSALDLFTFYKGKKVTINGFQLRLPVRYYKYYPSDYEKENFQFLKHIAREGMISIDVGGQFGLMTTYINSLTKSKVYTFEPTGSTFDVLSNTIRINNLQQFVTPVKAAVTEKKGTVVFFSGTATGDASNSLVNYDDKQHAQKGNKTDAYSIDEFVTEQNIKKVGILKIDAEGAELSVLKGAKNTLQNHRPSGILALHPSSIAAFGDNLESIYDFMMQYNFNLLYNNQPVSKEVFCEKKDLFDVGFIPA